MDMNRADYKARKFIGYPQSVVGENSSVKNVASPGNLWWKDYTLGHRLGTRHQRQHDTAMKHLIRSSKDIRASISVWCSCLLENWTKFSRLRRSGNTWFTTWLQSGHVKVVKKTKCDIKDNNF